MSGPIPRGITSIIVAGSGTKVTVDIYGRVINLGTTDLSTSDVTGILAAGRFPALTGDMSTPSGSLTTTLATVNSNIGSFALATVTVNAKGLVTAASQASTTGSGSVVLATSPTITTPTIAKLANLTTNGFVKTSAGDGTLSVDTSTYITGNQTITLSGDASGSGATAITVTLANVNANVGSFALATITVNGKGLVTAASAASTTGSGNVVLASSPTIVTPAVASFANANHNHQDSAGGGTLSAAAIAAGAIALVRGGTAVDLSATGSSTAFLAQDASHVISARAIISADINTALLTPGPIGSTPNTGSFTTVSAIVTDTATNTVTNVLTIDHDSSGTPTASYGTSLLIRGKSSTTSNRSMGRIRTVWTTATDASRIANVILSVFNTAEVDVLTLLPTGNISVAGGITSGGTISGTQYNVSGVVTLDRTTTTLKLGNDSFWQAQQMYVAGALTLSLTTTGLTIADAKDIALGTTTGTKIGTATSQKLALWNTTPIVQPTTAVAAGTLVSNLGTPLTSTDTIDGYTLLQVVKALRNFGLLA